MRLFMIVAVICLAVALIVAVTGAALAASALTWAIAGLFCWAVDSLVGAVRIG